MCTELEALRPLSLPEEPLAVDALEELRRKLAEAFALPAHLLSPGPRL